MSSPSRLLRGRPTAPLPTQYGSNSVNSLHKSELEEEETKSPSFSGQNKKSSTHRPSSCCTSVDVDVDILSSGERVKDYLRSHKRFLEEFIFEELPQETLEKIVIRKTQRRGSTTGKNFQSVCQLQDGEGIIMFLFFQILQRRVVILKLQKLTLRRF